MWEPGPLADEGHHAVAVHCAVALGRRAAGWEDARRAAALAVAAVATVAAAALARPDGDEERVPAALSSPLHRAVLVVRKLILRARPEPPGPPG